MVDGRGRQSIDSPELNPLDAFWGDDQEGISGDDVRSDDLVPVQIPSIINEQAVVRYYADGSKTPIIISDGHQGTTTSKEVSHPGKDQDGLSFLDVSLRLDVTTGCGGKIWPAAEVLGEYIASKRRQGQWSGKTIVELGAGTGLVGLLAAKIPDVTHVWITDQIPMMQLMKDNLALNGDVQSRVSVSELNWGEPVPNDVPVHPDILLLADCVYLEVAFQPLVDTMCDMCTPSTEVLFCYQQRRKADKRFFKLLKKHFVFTDIADDDQIRKTQYNRQGTHLYRVVKKQ